MVFSRFPFYGYVLLIPLDSNFIVGPDHGIQFYPIVDGETVVNVNIFTHVKKFKLLILCAKRFRVQHVLS